MNNVEHSQFIIIHKWQLEICDGDACAAALLNFFAYWHEIRLAKQKDNSQNNNLLQWYTNAELQDRLMIFCRKRIQSAVKKLITLGFITVHKNPNPRYGFDHTRHFLFHPEQLSAYLDESKSADAKVPTEPNCISEAPIVKAENTLHIGLSSPIEEDDSACSVGESDPHNRLLQPEQYNRLHTRLLTKITNKTTNKITDKNTSKITNKITGNFFINSAFLKFWEKWKNLTGNGVKQKIAQEIFEKLVNSKNPASEELFNKIILGLENQAELRKIRAEFNLFNPHWPNPDTWLRNSRWEDEVILDPQKIKQEIMQNPKLQNQIINQQREKILDEEYSSLTGDSRQAAFAAFDAELRAYYLPKPRGISTHGMAVV